MIDQRLPRPSTSFLQRNLRHLAAVAFVCSIAFPANAEDAAAPPSTPEAETTSRATGTGNAKQKEMALFLERLMVAESGGRDDARNPRSTAAGPFQFIESTFVALARQHFATETGELSTIEVLKLRTNRTFATRAAEAYARDNAALLASAGFDPTFPRLRLAHLVGPGGALRILQAPPQTPVGRVLGNQVVRANPFLARMTSAGLVAWSERNLAAASLANGGIAGDPSRLARNRSASVRPEISVRCNRSLPSCRRWVALARKRSAQRLAVGKRTTAGH